MGNTPSTGPFRRKLEPGEIVEVPDDLLTDDGQNLMDVLWKTGAIDLVPDNVAPTRPLDYANRREAQYCSPNYRNTGPDDERQMNEVRAKVQARLFESSESPSEDGSPEEDTPAPIPDPPPVAARSLPATKARTRRGARPKAADHGAQATT